MKINNTNIKKSLSKEQYRITQECGTEPAFHNAYWDNKQEGIYVDIITGKPLFISTDKYDSGTGWPSFTKPIDDNVVTEHDDKSLGTIRTEIKSRSSSAHLGHVFHDGPASTGRRYCINSAALQFIPKEDLKKEGYEQYQKYFHEEYSNEEEEEEEKKAETVYLAAGCFWGVEAYLKLIPGVLNTTVGYIGDTTKPCPTYNELCTSTTGFAEAVQVKFYPKALPYKTLLAHFFRMHDPTSVNKQGNDVGSQYRSEIVTTTTEHEQLTREYLKDEQLRQQKPIATKLTTITTTKFCEAEEEHQNYLEKHPKGYCHIDLHLANKPL